MGSPVWKFGVVRDFNGVNVALRRLRTFLYQFQKQTSNQAVRTLSVKLEDGGTAVGDVFQYQQDTNSGSWIFTEAIVEVTGAVSSGGLNVGVATNNTTNSSNLLFDIDLSTTGITVGGASVRLDPGDWINATANADPTGLTGNLYLIYVKAGPAA